MKMTGSFIVNRNRCTLSGYILYALMMSRYPYAGNHVEQIWVAVKCTCINVNKH